MKKLLVALVLLSAAPAFAQTVVITNARVIDGTGRVLERGSVVVRDGKIVSVAAGNQPAGGAQVIDAKGMTVMPGFIDAHRHVIRGEGQQWLKQDAAARMQEFLESGFTTVLSAIDDPAILELRRRSSAGEIVAPRIFAAQFIPLARPPAAPAARG
ncbi:MAG: amidohydrolase family protein, partial [Acidimicrobiia bacterium]|nr:amidohydrolase family protein [Acidimicrobiia bacterium]